MTKDKQQEPKLSIVIPVYNSEDSLEELVARLGKVLPDISSCFEVILVNDGSRDRSWEIIRQLGQQYTWIHGINMMRNYGQHNALLCGLRAANYEIVVTLDDDLQHPPEEIPLLLAKIDEGFDVVYGTPVQQQHGLWRNLASVITKLSLQGAMGVGNARNVSSFRAVRTQTREAFTQFRSPFVVLDVLLTWGTTRFTSVPTHHEPRQRGKSNYTFGKLIQHAINMVTGFTILPLQFASLLGFGFAVFGVLVLIYVIGRYLIQGGSAPGFPFLASTIAIFSGVQLFALGIIGEYLARMHFRSMEKPTYTMREQFSSQTSEEEDQTNKDSSPPPEGAEKGRP
ncbi:glycosyltransferase family 2 protein [Chloroflexota bacterium]